MGNNPVCTKPPIKASCPIIQSAFVLVALDILGPPENPACPIYPDEKSRSLLCPYGCWKHRCLGWGCYGCAEACRPSCCNPIRGGPCNLLLPSPSRVGGSHSFFSGSGRFAASQRGRCSLMVAGVDILFWAAVTRYFLLGFANFSPFSF